MVDFRPLIAVLGERDIHFKVSKRLNILGPLLQLRISHNGQWIEPSDRLV
jgi:hypothetical protein